MTFQKKLTPTETAALVSKVGNGMSKAQAAREFGISYRTVFRIFEDLRQLDKRPKKLHPCGTIGAYRRHVKKGERCWKCSAANAKYEKDRTA